METVLATDTACVVSSPIATIAELQCHETLDASHSQVELADLAGQKIENTAQESSAEQDAETVAKNKANRHLSGISEGNIRQNRTRSGWTQDHAQAPALQTQTPKRNSVSINNSRNKSPAEESSDDSAVDVEPEAAKISTAKPKRKRFRLTMPPKPGRYSMRDDIERKDKQIEELKETVKVLKEEYVYLNRNKAEIHSELKTAQKELAELNELKQFFTALWKKTIAKAEKVLVCFEERQSALPVILRDLSRNYNKPPTEKRSYSAEFLKAHEELSRKRGGSATLGFLQRELGWPTSLDAEKDAKDVYSAPSSGEAFWQLLFREEKQQFAALFSSNSDAKTKDKPAKEQEVVECEEPTSSGACSCSDSETSIIVNADPTEDREKRNPDPGTESVLSRPSVIVHAASLAMASFGDHRTESCSGSSENVPTKRAQNDSLISNQSVGVKRFKKNLVSSKSPLRNERNASVPREHSVSPIIPVKTLPGLAELDIPVKDKTAAEAEPVPVEVRKEQRKYAGWPNPPRLYFDSSDCDTDDETNSMVMDPEAKELKPKSMKLEHILKAFFAKPFEKAAKDAVEKVAPMPAVVAPSSPEKPASEAVLPVQEIAWEDKTKTKSASTRRSPRGRNKTPVSGKLAAVLSDSQDANLQDGNDTQATQKIPEVAAQSTPGDSVPHASVLIVCKDKHGDFRKMPIPSGAILKQVTDGREPAKIPAASPAQRRNRKAQASTSPRCIRGSKEVWDAFGQLRDGTSSVAEESVPDDSAPRTPVLAVYEDKDSNLHQMPIPKGVVPKEVTDGSEPAKIPAPNPIQTPVSKPTSAAPRRIRVSKKVLEAFGEAHQKAWTQLGSQEMNLLPKVDLTRIAEGLKISLDAVFPRLEKERNKWIKQLREKATSSDRRCRNVTPPKDSPKSLSMFDQLKLTPPPPTEEALNATV